MRRAIFILLYCLVILFLCLGLLEISYRYQWIDFYKVELKELNRPSDLRNSTNKKKILIAGDSFTASPFSYVSNIRDSLPSFDVINSAVPGIGIMQTSYYLPDRIGKFQPDIFIYQVYVGNDLLDITHPYSKQVSFIRNIYWWMSDHFRILGWINYRLGSLKYKYYNDIGELQSPTENASFDEKKYSGREKLIFQAEPELIENSLYLKNGREKDMDLLCSTLNELISKLPVDCKKYLVIIPHSSQVNKQNFINLGKIGAMFSKQIYSENDFPFYKKLQNVLGKKVNIIDPLSFFRNEEANGINLFYENDPHLNKVGQIIFGKYLANLLKSTTKDLN